MPSQTLWMNKVTNNRSRFLCAINLFSMGCTVAPTSEIFSDQSHTPAAKRHHNISFYLCFVYTFTTAKTSVCAFLPLFWLYMYHRGIIICLSSFVSAWHIQQREHSVPFCLCFGYKMTCYTTKTSFWAFLPLFVAWHEALGQHRVTLCLHLF